MAGKAFNNLDKIFLSDTFRAWFDKTNQVVDTLNPLEIYGVTHGTGEIAGITMQFGTDGIATIGLDLPDSLTGDFTFTTGVTFQNFVSVTGLTIDIGHSGHGATVYGRVVRTVNGETGDISLNFLAAPGTSTDGDILYYENTGAGATWRAYNLFSDGTADNGMMHIGGSGGVFFGITAGGASSANEFVKLGNIQLVGTTASGIYMVDNSQTSLSTAKIAGADIRYGTEGSSQLLTIGGRNISGLAHNTKNLILDFNRQSMIIGGAAVSSVGTTNAILDIRDEGNIGVPIQYTDNSGSTFSVKYLLGGETGEGKTSGGVTGTEHGNPSTTGLIEDKRIRLANVDGSVEIEIEGSGKTSGFVVYGKTPEYENLLLPTLHARRDGNVVIGAIAPSDGGGHSGGTGTTFGGLNIASGKLYVGGSAGAIVNSGYQVLHSSGSSASWQMLEGTAFSYSGDIGSPINGTINEITEKGTDIEINEISSIGQGIYFRNSSGENQTGPFSGTVNFPLVRLDGSIQGDKGVLGVRIITDDTIIEDKFIRWDDFITLSIGPSNGYLDDYKVAPTFTFNGVANTSLRIIPFMTTGTAYGAKQIFTFVNRGTYLVNFHKLG